MPWGGIWNILTIPVTGQAEFDWFFTVIMAFALMGVMINMLIRLVSRS